MIKAIKLSQFLRDQSSCYNEVLCSCLQFESEAKLTVNHSGGKVHWRNSVICREAEWGYALYLCIWVQINDNLASTYFRGLFYLLVVLLIYHADYIFMPIPAVAQYKEWVCCRSITGIVDSNPAGAFLSLVNVVCVVRSLRRADPSSRGVLSIMCVYHWMWSGATLTLYSSVSQPQGRGPVPGPGINYIGPREVLLEFVILIF